MPRLFFGLELPIEWKTFIRSEQERLQKTSVQAGAWSNPKLLHITVLFIGVVNDADVEAFLDAGRTAAAASEPIRLATGRYGQFSRNKVFWLGLDKNLTQWDKLLQLNQMVRREVLDRLPLDLDDKHFKPHITMARKLRAQVDVDKLKAPNQMTVVVPELCLFESTRVDGELVYPVRARFPFSDSSLKGASVGHEL